MTATESSSGPAVLPLRGRRRALAAVGAVALVAVVVVLVVIVARGAGEQPPATGAAAVVPGSALAYVHLSTDSKREAVRRARTLEAKFPDYPLLYAGLLRRVGAILGGGRAVSPSEVAPWLGKEAAVALLNTPGTTAGSLIVLDVKSHRRALAFLTAAGATPDGSYDRTPLLRYRTGTELAFVKHYLALGQDASVRAAIDVASGRMPSLASSSAYRRAADGEPADRVLDAYASPGGVRRVLSAQRGLLGVIGSLLNQAALEGTTFSLSAVSGGARIRVHSALNSNVVRLGGSGPIQFSPTLQGAVPSTSMLLLDVTGLDRVAPRILSAGAAVGVGTTIAPLLSRLGAALASEGIDVQNVASIFDGESAVAIASQHAAPSLVIIARTSNSTSARDTLAALEAPLAQLFPAPTAGSGQVPEFNDIQVGGVSAHQLALTTGLQIDYAVFDGMVVVSTSADGIAAVASHARSLASDPTFRQTLANRPDQVTSLVFLDFSQLLSLGEQTGLLRSARLRALQPDLERIRAVGLDSTGGEADSTTELFLKIS